MTMGGAFPASLQELPAKTAARLVRGHLYRIARGKAGRLQTEAPSPCRRIAAC